MPVSFIPVNLPDTFSPIRSMERNRSGRPEVRLIGDSGPVFTIGKKYERSFRELFFDMG